MLKIYLAFMIGVFALSLPAKEVDLSEVKGTDQIKHQRIGYAL